MTTIKGAAQEDIAESTDAYAAQSAQLEAMRKALEEAWPELKDYEGTLIEQGDLLEAEEILQLVNRIRAALATDAGNPTAHHKTGGE